MGNTIRFGVSLDSELLEKFDKELEANGYNNRSEAIRDLIRKSLVEKEWEDSKKDIAATLTLVYDHHKNDVLQKITDIQHDYHDIIVTSLHVHLDHDNCLEVLVIKGKSMNVHQMANRLIATKGIVFGKLSLATTGVGLK